MGFHSNKSVDIRKGNHTAAISIQFPKQGPASEANVKKTGVMEHDDIPGIY
jgi:hypothetical protein